jgi:hypothetical protein
LPRTDDQLADNGTDVPLTICPDGSWCADNVGGSQGCCAAGNGFFITQDGTVTLHNGSAVSVSSSSSSSSSAAPTSSTSSPSNPSSGATSTTSSTSTPISTSTPAQKSSSSGLSSGAKAGVGIGVALGVVALLLGGYFFLRKARRIPDLKDNPKAQEMYQPAPPAEMQATPAYAEMGPPQRPQHKSIVRKSSLGTTATPAQLE